MIGVQDQVACRKRLAIKVVKKWRNLVYRNRLRKQREPERILSLFDNDLQIVGGNRCLHVSSKAEIYGTHSSDIFDLLKARPRVLESTQPYPTVDSPHVYSPYSSKVSSPPFTSSIPTSSSSPSKSQLIYESEVSHERSADASLPQPTNPYTPYKSHTYTPHSLITEEKFCNKTEDLSYGHSNRNIGKIKNIVLEGDTGVEGYVKGGKGYGLAYAAPRRPISFVSPLLSSSSLSLLPPQSQTSLLKSQFTSKISTEVRDINDRKIDDIALIRWNENKNEDKNKSSNEYNYEVKDNDRSNKSIQSERKNILALEIINFISEMKNSDHKS